MKASFSSTKIFILACTLVLSCQVFFSANTASGQRIQTFSDEPQLFASEINSIVKDHLQKDEEQVVRDFMLFWESDTLLADQKSVIIDISNHLLMKTVVNTRHFTTLIKIIMLYSKNEKLQAEFNTWIEGLSIFAKDDRILIAWLNKFLENSHALFTRNTFVINPAFEWRVSNNNYSFKIDQTLTIKFSNTDLICANKTDSIAIIGTSGTYYPKADNWIGNGGKVTWIRSMLPVNEVFATLNSYKIDLTRNEYEADSVLFINLDYFREPSLGKLKDKITKTTKPENIIFPEFHTYDQRHKIRDLFENVDFDGGYYMMGSQFIGSGTRENPAVIIIKRNNEDFLRVESRTYVLRRQTIVSDYARVRFRLDSDSLFHTGLNFNYNDETNMVSISPTDFLTTQSPILSTYHNFSIKFGQISWNTKTEEIVFSAPFGSSLGRAFFESNNYFNQEEFDRLMGRDEQHPLFAIANFTRRIQSRSFKVEEFSRFVRKSIEQTRIEVLRLAMLGFVFYEFETGDVQALPKLYDALRARGKFIDYDVLKFNSTIEGAPNAILNLNNFEMAIRGVENVSVSDSQNVFLYPARRELILKKDRNFAFDGVIVSGLFTFYGNDFNFNYENFHLELNSIDSLHIDYQTKDYDMYGRRVLNKVTSTLENITGEILIDKPDNKSGLVQNEEYPIFNSTKHSFVYYDDETIHGGIYKRDNFYFEIFPFTFYNLNNFEYSDMNFIGMFYSANIFSPLEDTLILRPDNSLGFRRISPKNGYGVYQGRGMFYNRIDLSNRGLRAEGKVTYITSTTSSDDLYFFPDSMRTNSTEFSIARQDAGISFPEVIGGKHLVKWHPYQENLYAYKGDKPFVMFHDQASLTGNLVLNPLGLTGDGFIDMKKARMRSQKYAFNATNFNTQKASAEFDDVDMNTTAFSSLELKARVDFDSREGKFNKINESIFADMAPMMYKSHLDQFTWAMDKNELTIATPSHQQAAEMEKFYVSGMIDKDTIPKGSLFYSIHADEDSLYFFAPKAKYRLRKPNIKADSVAYISIADAIIIPDQHKLEVDAKDRVKPLVNSKIIANYLHKYHNIYNAKIGISSRKLYYASGTIDYIDERDSIQPITLNDIRVDNRGNTYAKTTLTEPDNFKLSQHFGYVGNIDLYAPEQYWEFTGGARPLHSCDHIRSSNVNFKAFLQPDSIYIPVPLQPQNINNNYLNSGSIVTVDSIHLYPAFMSGRKEYSDKALVDASGYLHYNNNRNRFLIGSKQKINNPDSLGNLISLSKDFCMLFSEGKINIPVNLGQVKDYSFGNLTHILADSALTMDMVLTLDFHFNPISLEAMATEINAHPGLTFTDLKRNIFRKSIFDRTSQADAEAALSQINLFGSFTEMPKELMSTISFPELRMRWDQANRSFVSYGKIGIGNIGNIQVNKRVDGFIEIYKRNTGDWMIMYLELAPDKYYSFYYVRGSMQVSSHNPLFTEPINQMKTRDRRVRVKAGQIPFNFVVGTRRELQRARDRYNQIIGRDANEAEEPEEAKDVNAESAVKKNPDDNTDDIKNDDKNLGKVDADESSTEVKKGIESKENE